MARRNNLEAVIAEMVRRALPSGVTLKGSKYDRYYIGKVRKYLQGVGKPLPMAELKVYSDGTIKFDLKKYWKYPPNTKMPRNFKVTISDPSSMDQLTNRAKSFAELQQVERMVHKWMHEEIRIFVHPSLLEE